VEINAFEDDLSFVVGSNCNGLGVGFYRGASNYESTGGELVREKSFPTRNVNSADALKKSSN
jgi:hypothetical protein